MNIEITKYWAGDLASKQLMLDSLCGDACKKDHVLSETERGMLLSGPGFVKLLKNSFPDIKPVSDITAEYTFNSREYTVERRGPCPLDTLPKVIVTRIQPFSIPAELHAYTMILQLIDIDRVTFLEQQCDRFMFKLESQIDRLSDRTAEAIASEIRKLCGVMDRLISNFEALCAGRIALGDFSRHG